jgi:hypothetical protein
MLRRLVAVLGLIAAMALVGGPTAQAREPLYGDMDLQFNLAWPGPSTEVPDWVGTVTIDGDVYGMAFFNTGTGKPFAEQPAAGVVFFEETWVIYEELDFSFAPDGTLATFVPGDVAMSGYDSGVSNIPSASYRMNGDVRAANDEFADWLGRSVHMMGSFEFYPFGAPYVAPGTFRIN